MLKPSFLIAFAVFWFSGCGGAGPRPSGGSSTSSSKPLSAPPSAPSSSLVDGVGVCPYTSELGPANEAVWPSCHAFPPMDFELPLVTCSSSAPCLKPCRRTDSGGGSVSYIHDYRYDAEGRLIEDVLRDPGGSVLETTAYRYTSRKEWTVEHVGMAASTTTYRMNDTGKLSERVARFSDETTLTFGLEYGPEGKPSVEHTKREDSAGRVSTVDTSYGYDSEGRLVEARVSNKSGPNFVYTYGSDGKVEAIKYHGISWHLRRDGEGRVVELLEESSPFERFLYDERGRLSKVQNVHGDGSVEDSRVYSYECAPAGSGR